LGKSRFQFQKRQKELERQRKKAEKLAKKRGKKLGQSPEELEPQPTGVWPGAGEAPPDPESEEAPEEPEPDA